MPEPGIELSESRIIYSTADLEADFPDFQPEPGKRDPPEADRSVTPIGPMHMHGLMDLPNGDLVVFFTADDDHWFRRVCGIRSRDRGETWRIDPEGETFASSAWCVLDDSVVYLLGHERTPSWQLADSSVWCIGNRSGDGGATFDGPTLVPCEIPGISLVEPFVIKRSPNTPFPRQPTAFGRHLVSEIVGSQTAAVAFPTGRILHLPDGGLLVTCQCTFGDTEKKDRTGFLKSTDNGASWFLASHIDHPDHRFSEASLELTLDGRVICVARSRQDEPRPLFQTYSIDGGVTWADLRPLDVCGVNPGLLRLSSSALLCTFGRTGPDSFASAAGKVIGDNKVMLSRDDGGSWETVTTVFDGLSTGYIVAVERSPGELLFVYDEQVEPGIRYAKRARWVIRAVDARIT